MHLRSPVVLCVASLALTLGGCERAAQVDAPNHLNTEGVSFDYPGNWEVKKNELQATGRYIQISSPGAAVAMIRLFPLNAPFDLKGHAHQIGEGMEKDFARSKIMSQGQAMTYTDVTKGKEHGVDLHYSVKVANVDVPHTMSIRVWIVGGTRVVTTVQFANKHAFQAEPGFDLITSTLKPYR